MGGSPADFEQPVGPSFEANSKPFSKHRAPSSKRDVETQPEKHVNMFSPRLPYFLCPARPEVPWRSLSHGIFPFLGWVSARTWKCRNGQC